ncbi:MAG: hypothetical protein V1787_04355 [Candidatus Micrarchaeota archaeon]
MAGHPFRYSFEAVLLIILLFIIYMSTLSWTKPPSSEPTPRPPERITGNPLCDYLILDDSRRLGEPAFLYYPQYFLNDRGYDCDFANKSGKGCYQLRARLPDGIVITGYRVADCAEKYGEGTRAGWLYCSSDEYVPLRKKVVSADGEILGFDRFRIFSAVFDSLGRMQACDVSRIDYTPSEN